MRYVEHVLDDLELHALGALPTDRAAAVEAHLGTCPACAAAAADVAEIVDLLPDAVPPREPPAALKARVLSSAAATARPRALSRWRWPSLRIPQLALAAAVVALAALDVSAAMRLQEAQHERDSYEAALEAVSHGGRWWYMAGVDSWTGSGGNLIAPGDGQPPMVVFHDLRDLSPGQTYALWLIGSDGRWVRGTSFAPDGEPMQVVAVGLDIGVFERCAVTVEGSPSGKREGPIVMQSRIAPPAP